jgi:hypothetical protein
VTLRLLTLSFASKKEGSCTPFLVFRTLKVSNPSLYGNHHQIGHYINTGKCRSFILGTSCIFKIDFGSWFFDFTDYLNMPASFGLSAFPDFRTSNPIKLINPINLQLTENQSPNPPCAFFNNLLTQKQTFFYLCAGVSLLRPAPLELPQGGNAARVES